MDVSKLDNALEKGKCVTIFGNFSIKYSGRAESYLSDGDRIIIIKSDKTLLIHQPKGSAPINYMKENTAYRLYSEGGKSILSCSNGKEYMTIIVNRIYSFLEHELIDGQKLQITGSEKDMSMMIFNNPGLIEAGFIPLSMEEHTKFGFIDVFGFDSLGNLVVVECKRYSADPKAVDQLKGMLTR